MISGNVRLAWDSVKAAKLRNVFTTLGIILGVASVVITVSLGQGVRNQVSDQVEAYGKDLLIVQPGKQDSGSSGFNSLNLLSSSATTVLTDDDFSVVKKISSVKSAAPITVLTGSPEYDGIRSQGTAIIGTDDNLLNVLGRDMAFGVFLGPEDVTSNFAVIGKHVAESLFNENVPIGRTFILRDQELIVKGVLKDFSDAPALAGINFDNSVIIGKAKAQDISNNSSPIIRILVRPKDPNQTNVVKAELQKALSEVRVNDDDFTVYRQDETISAASNIFSVLTALVAAIGLVSLVLGGVGIMNVMLVSVTERTHEIGVRKAVGATDRQIMQQFLIESVMLTVVGSVLGVLLAGIVGVVLALTTDLQPAVTWPVVGIAIVAAFLVGIVFGVLPAVKAARKDPITALRNE